MAAAGSTRGGQRWFKVKEEGFLLRKKSFLGREERKRERERENVREREGNEPPVL